MSKEERFRKKLSEARTSLVASLVGLVFIILSLFFFQLVLPIFGINLDVSRISQSSPLGEVIVLTFVFATIIALFFILWSGYQFMSAGKYLNEDTKNKYPNLSIIGILLKRRLASSLLSYVLLLLSFTISYLFDASGISSLIILIILILAIIRQQVFEYRIRHGYYGKNKREAREIIDFILANTENIDFTDGGKPKDIITAQDIAELQAKAQKALQGLPEPA